MDIRDVYVTIDGGDESHFMHWKIPLTDSQFQKLKTEVYYSVSEIRGEIIKP